MNHRTGRNARNTALIRIGMAAAAIAAWTLVPATQSQQQTSPNSSAQQNSATNSTSQSTTGTPSPASATATTPQRGSSQTPSQQSTAPAAQAAPEVNTQESQVPFRVRVNLVPIRVVVHDSKGQPVKDLKREDFKIFQDGKPQVISTFSVETPNALAKRAEAAAKPADASSSGAAAGEEKPTSVQLPTRFVALLFDDVHVDVGDFMRARNAAVNFVQHSLQPNDRAAILTFSGQWQQDFTDDHAKLQDALLAMKPTGVTAFSSNGESDCPPMDYYEADQIENKNNQTALAVAISDAIACDPAAAQHPEVAGADVQAEAIRILQAGSMETQYSIRGLQGVLRRITALPGQRVIVLVSPGFIYPTFETDLWNIVDQAARTNVIINTLDARGLYVSQLGGDISQRKVGSPTAAGARSMMREEAQSAESDVLSTLAYGTGGFFFHNNNDLQAGIQSLGQAPEVSYLLGYTPEALKMDGKFHSLKVTLAVKGSYAIQARKGFVAPRHEETPAEAAKQEIEDAVFSQEVESGIPIAMHTQYYMAGASAAKLSIQARVDVGHMRFQKADGRNLDDLTVVAALFDRNGNYINGYEKLVQLKLRDATLERLSRTGMTVTTDFDVKPGAYVVRLVVRDSDADMLSTQNGVVEIPY
ncbi:MAG TPA: VWA domain-containing protein [Candidatus Acidoferrales bacterium]|nr:VWA domain-containing protein [Candidatus Acidoferrales bacterium]